MRLDYQTYRKKLAACYVGKTVGGTLGIPREGHIGFAPVSYYDPVPTEMLPNDDLDLQISNLQILMQHGFPVCRFHLGYTWKYYNRCSLPDEYGIARANYEKRLFAPLSGTYNNRFHGGMGAAIRSELWACLAPCDPALAVRMAVEDACVDHADDGILAECFLAAMESAAFGESSIHRLIEIGMGFLPSEHRMAQAFRDTVMAWETLRDPALVRERVLEKYPSDNWTDVTVNLCFILIALLAAEGSFDRAICTAASLGHDTDCTCATVGALFAILFPDSIDRRWTDPIGKELVLSRNMTNMQTPADITAFSDRVAFVCREALAYYGSSTAFTDVPPSLPSFQMAPPHTARHGLIAYSPSEEKAALLALAPLAVTLVYPEEVAYVYDGREYEMKLRLANTDPVAKKGTLRLRAAEGTVVTPDFFEVSLEEGEVCECRFKVKKMAAPYRVSVNLLMIDLCLCGIRATVEAAFPDARRFRVENLDTGEISFREVTGNAFSVPRGRYRYSIAVKSAVTQEMRLAVSGTSAVTVLHNGREIFARKADRPYIPTLHRSACARVEVGKGEQRFDLLFDNEKDGECFMDFGTVSECGEWITTNEYACPAFS